VQRFPVSHIPGFLSATGRAATLAVPLALLVSSRLAGYCVGRLATDQPYICVNLR
jgi:hypothetical protein